MAVSLKINKQECVIDEGGVNDEKHVHDAEKLLHGEEFVRHCLLCLGSYRCGEVVPISPHLLRRFIVTCLGYFGVLSNNQTLKEINK